VGTVEHVYWPYRNRSGVALGVPLALDNYNNMLSPRGGAAPETLFAPGLNNGFSRPLQLFESGNRYSGIWNILGLSVELPQPLALCPDSGDGGECTPIRPAALNTIFDQAASTVNGLIIESLRLQASGAWEPERSRRNPISTRGAAVLSDIRGIVRQVQPSGSTIYTCEAVVPASCRRLEFPKNALRSAFAELFDLRLPDGLESLNSSSRVRRESKKFEDALKRLPRRYVRCD
jgi:hypothetical protein